MKNIILLLILILFTPSCGKQECQFTGAYAFEIPATLSPAKVTYQIGDTITITSIFSDQVYEVQTDQFYPLIDFKFYPTFELNEISDSIIDQAALNNFEVIIDTMTYDLTQFIYSSGSVTYDGQYLYKEGIYSLVYQLIPKKVGFYDFYQSTLVGDVGEEPNFPGKCQNKNLFVRTILNDRANNNVGLARNSPNEFYNTQIVSDPESLFTNLGGYIFYVVE